MKNKLQTQSIGTLSCRIRHMISDSRSNFSSHKENRPETGTELTFERLCTFHNFCMLSKQKLSVTLYESWNFEKECIFFLICRSSLCLQIGANLLICACQWRLNFETRIGELLTVGIRHMTSQSGSNFHKSHRNRPEKETSLMSWPDLWRWIEFLTFVQHEKKLWIKVCACELNVLSFDQITENQVMKSCFHVYQNVHRVSFIIHWMILWREWTILGDENLLTVVFFPK
jgi:hypothetical protein